MQTAIDNRFPRTIPDGQLISIVAASGIMRALDWRPNLRVVFAYLTAHADGNRQLLATYNDIAEAVRSDRTGVGVAVRTLSRLGLITRQRIETVRGNVGGIYRFTIAEPDRVREIAGELTAAAERKKEEVRQREIRRLQGRNERGEFGR